MSGDYFNKDGINDDAISVLLLAPKDYQRMKE
jgi:hypothetical protein